MVNGVPHHLGYAYFLPSCTLVVLYVRFPQVTSTAVVTESVNKEGLPKRTLRQSIPVSRIPCPIQQGRLLVAPVAVIGSWMCAILVYKLRRPITVIVA